MKFQLEVSEDKVVIFFPIQVRGLLVRHLCALGVNAVAQVGDSSHFPEQISHTPSCLMLGN